VHDLTGQTVIKGFVELDTSWNKVIYASYIPSMYDLYKCSEELIIGDASIDPSGNWTLELPAFDQQVLIRLHVSKKGDPPASLIIGGKEENHGFIGVKHADTLQYLGSTSTKLFIDFAISNSDLNDQLAQIKSIVKRWEDLDLASVDQDKKTMLRKAASMELIKYADTTLLILPALYAIQLSDVGFNRTEVNDAIFRLSKRFPYHPYLNVYALPKATVKWQPWMLGILLFFMISTFCYIGFKRYVAMKRQKRINSLSIRERQVFEMIGEGKSNKEIAVQLNVEISTIKSHVNNIYSKLDISSRKDAHLYL
jgi:DNA-binding CsgD family transcriptional regulator